MAETGTNPVAQALLEEEERKRKAASAISNQDPSVVAGNKTGQTPLGGGITPLGSGSTPKTAGSKVPDVSDPNADPGNGDGGGYVPPPVPGVPGGTPPVPPAVPPPAESPKTETTPLTVGMTAPASKEAAQKEYDDTEAWIKRNGGNAGINGKAVMERQARLQKYIATGVWDATPTTTPGTTTPSPYKFANGKGPNLDKAYIESQIRAAKPGISDADVAYWVGKALTPDIYSDHKTRVGWNDYLKARLQTGAASADPALAGEEGVILDYTGPTSGGLSDRGFLANGGSIDPSMQGQLSAWGQNAPQINVPQAAPLTPAQVQALQSPYQGQAVTAVGSLTAPRLGAVAPVTPQTMQASTVAAGSPVQTAAAQAAQVNAPTYQTYNFKDRNVATQTIDPATIGQYTAGKISQFQGANVAPVNDLVQSLLSRLSATSAPDTAGLKEAQKETLAAIQKQQMDAVAQSAAARGVAGGNPMAANLAIGDQFSGNLSKAYRDIDQQAQQQAFDNLLKTLGAGTDVSNMLTGQAQSNFTTGLQGETAQEALKQAAAASGQAKTAQQQDVLTQLFNQMLGNEQLGLTVEQQRAKEQQFAQEQAQAVALQQAAMQQQANLATAANQQQSYVTQAQLDANRALEQARLQQQAAIQNGDWAQAARLQQQTLEAQRAVQQANLEQQAAIQSGDWQQQANTGTAQNQQQAALAAQLAEVQRQQANAAATNQSQQAQAALEAQRQQLIAQLTNSNWQFGQNLGQQGDIAFMDAMARLLS